MYKRWIEAVGCEKLKELMIPTMPIVLSTVCLLSRCEKWKGTGEAHDGRLKTSQLWGNTPSSCDAGETKKD